MRPAPLPSPGPRLTGRRALLAGALGSAALALTGCGIRLEDDAPALPLIPTREAIPAEAALLWLLADCRELSASQGPHTDLYAEQSAVLRSALFRAGVPIETLDEGLEASPGGTATSPTTTSTTTTSTTTTAATVTATSAATPTPTPTPTPSAFTAPEAAPDAALRRVGDLAGCGPALFPVVMSLLSQRAAVVSLRDGEPPAGAEAVDPAYLWRFPHLAAGFVEPTHAAVYGFEVVAAQSREETRGAAVRTLAELRLLRRRQVTRAGGSTPPPAIAYSLPFPVESEETARALATHVLAGLTAAYGGLLTTVTGAAQADTAADVVAWLGSAAAWADEWGAPLTAFPGTHAGA